MENLAAENEDGYGGPHNIFKTVNQLEIEGTEKRIPDAILYLNALPLVVFEFKSAIREEATINDAYVQLTTRYCRDIPELIKYNALCVISDGVNSRMGSLSAPTNTSTPGARSPATKPSSTTASAPYLSRRLSRAHGQGRAGTRCFYWAV